MMMDFHFSYTTNDDSETTKKSSLEFEKMNEMEFDLEVTERRRESLSTKQNFHLFTKRNPEYSTYA